MDPHDPDAAAIAEFHRAARKRKAVIFAVAAVISILAGAAAIVVAFSVEPPDQFTTRRYEVKVIVLGAALVVAGLGMAYNAYRIGTGKILDVE